MNLDAQTIDIPCPGCGHQMAEQIGRLKRNPTLHCPRCHQTVDVEAGELTQAIDNIQREVDKLAQVFNRLGKR